MKWSLFLQKKLQAYNSKRTKMRIFAISIQDLEKTNFQNNMFDYITSLSVIEHRC